MKGVDEMVRRGVTRRLFVWEEEMSRECVKWLTSIVLQVGVGGLWV